MQISMDAYVCEIRGNRAGDRSDMITVVVTYESAGILGSLTFDVGISKANKFFIGQKISIVVTLE